MPAQLLSTISGHTLILTLSNSEHQNALSPEIYAAGIEAFNVAGDNPEVRAVIINGEGDTFCSGSSVARLMALRQLPPESLSNSIESWHTWIEAIETSPKPVIAAVEGLASGAGFALALCCDLIVASISAHFVMTGSNIGLSPDGGASWNLPRAIPHQLAMELLMCSENIGAKRLYQLGIVNRLCQAGQSLGNALAWADEISERAPNALSSIKELVHEAHVHSLNTHLAHERRLLVKNLLHKNAEIGMSAHLGKRKPYYE